MFAIVQWAYVLWKPSLPWPGSRWWLVFIWLHNGAFMVLHWHYEWVLAFQLYVCDPPLLQMRLPVSNLSSVPRRFVSCRTGPFLSPAQFTAWAVIAVIRLVALYRTEMRDVPVLRRLIKLYVASWLSGTAAWLIDQRWCDEMHALPVNPQGHMWWHFAVGLSSYVGPVSLTYLEARKRGLKPEIVFTHGNLLPYVRSNVKSKK